MSSRDDGSNGSPPLVGDKLNYLFEHRLRPDGKPYTQGQLVEAVERYAAFHNQPDARVGESFLSRLRKWPTRHPDALSPERREAVAYFFNVDVVYFNRDCPVDRPPWLELGAPTRAAAPSEQVLEVYGRGLSMTPMQLEVWLQMADLVKKMAAGSQNEAKPADQ